MNRVTLSFFVAIASLASFSLSLWFAYQSGCAGDLKGGSYGDIQLASRYDTAFGYSLLAGLGLGMTAPLFADRDSPRIVRYAALGMVPLTFLLWLAGMQFGIWGVQLCFPR